MPGAEDDAAVRHGPDGHPGTAELLSRLARHRVVGIVRHPDPAVAEQLASAMLRGGLVCVEVTQTVPGAAGVIARVRAAYPDRYVGAGTVVRPTEVDAVADAGADYVVTPAVRPAVVSRCAERGIPTLTGLMTPTELYAALDLGVRAVKLFPAGTLGPGHLAALREIAPDVAYVPTGGVGVDNAAAWLDRGATAVAVGSEFRRAWERAGGWSGGAAAVAAHAGALLAAVGVDPA